jgi:hypothetical protein
MENGRILYANAALFSYEVKMRDVQVFDNFVQFYVTLSHSIKATVTIAKSSGIRTKIQDPPLHTCNWHIWVHWSLRTSLKCFHQQRH